MAVPPSATPPEPQSAPAPPGVPAWAVALATGALLLIVLGVHGVRSGGIEALLVPGDQAPATAIVRRDIPDAHVLDDRAGFDGTTYYAIARHLPDLDAAVPWIGGRPAYRFQRIGLPALSRLIHPITGGGRTLVWSLLIANVTGVALGVAGLAQFARRHLRSPVIATAYAMGPWSLMPLVSTLPEASAAGFALAATAALDRGRYLVATALGCGAVLTKETTAVLLVTLALGLAMRRRTWGLLVPAGAACAVGLSWMVWLRRAYPSAGMSGSEFKGPFVGVFEAVRETADHAPGSSWLAVGYSILVLLALLIVSFRHRRVPAVLVPVLIMLLFQSLLGAGFVYKLMNATRFSAPAAALALAVAVSWPGERPRHRIASVTS